ncbi:Uroporphyrinogen-III synthase [Tepidimonas alkaliphilus]|uniref:Uroporphyrinogen-III synthase n=1 Tax=Tepidimonas alkaliphilus TaxID=2588942 RepID=A0A554WCX0_9BURK|nr:uroporphyrinogen-III synthase [Tepidimonas alkaliphilus]TSE21404.1 Uroporphyrinogen-III synthase [Tepidimonas alkaliphilus]
MARRTVVVTRPQGQASAWAQTLRAAGWPVQWLPLLAIESLLEPGMPPPWAEGALDDAVMVVSPTAVEVMRRAGWPPPPEPMRGWAPGPGTARALQAWGVPANRVDSVAPDADQMDSETLWPRVASQVRPGWRLLVLRGISEDGRMGRDTLLQQVRAAGGQAREVAVYRRQAPRWTAAQRALAQRCAQDAVWLFSSAEAVTHLRRLLPQQRWQDALALATHPRIAEAAQQAGFGRVQTARPDLRDVLQALESMG